MDFANFASQLNAGTILPEGIVMITLLLYTFNGIQLPPLPLLVVLMVMT
jgi:hypothetical protein